VQLTYLFITLIIVFGHCEDFLGTTLLSRPLVLGPLVGLALGDLHQGILIGASLELIFMGNIKVGAAIPPDVVTGGVLGTAFAILSGKGAAIALALAVPISILAEMLLSPCSFSEVPSTSCSRLTRKKEITGKCNGCIFYPG